MSNQNWLPEKSRPLPDIRRENAELRKALAVLLVGGPSAETKRLRKENQRLKEAFASALDWLEEAEGGEESDDARAVAEMGLDDLEGNYPDLMT